MDRIGHILGGRSTIGSVELDTKVIIGTTGVVRSSEEDTTIGLEGSNKGRTSGGGEDGVLAENDVLDAVGSTDTEDNLGSLGRLKLEWKLRGTICISPKGTQRLHCIDDRSHSHSIDRHHQQQWSCPRDLQA